MKDSIDVAGFATTGACPTLTTPATRNAAAVEQPVAAVPIPIGKTNMDQFATGLVGTRASLPFARLRVDRCANRLDEEHRVAWAAPLAGFTADPAEVSEAPRHQRDRELA